MGKSTPFFETTFYTRTIPGSLVCFLAIEATSVVPCNFFPFLQVLRLNKRINGYRVFVLGMTHSLDGTFSSAPCFFCSVFGIGSALNLKH